MFILFIFFPNVTIVVVVTIDSYILWSEYT